MTENGHKFCVLLLSDDYSELNHYEQKLGVRWSDQRLEWDFYTALLFAGTICTTIGKKRSMGRIVINDVCRLRSYLSFDDSWESFYYDLCSFWHSPGSSCSSGCWTNAHFQHEISLVSNKTLDEKGSAVWLIAWHSFSRCFTKQSKREMREIEELERRDLKLFDLPIVVGVSLIVGWV